MLHNETSIPQASTTTNNNELNWHFLAERRLRNIKSTSITRHWQHYGKYINLNIPI